MAIPYTKQSWTDGAGGGTPISAARLGVIEQGILDVSLSPTVRVTHNASQNLTSGTPLALAFNTESWDQAGGVADTMHDTVTNNSRLTCRYAGIYLVSGTVEIQANATGFRSLSFRLNGVTSLNALVFSSVSAGATAQMNLTGLHQLAVNDYLELLANQNSGSTLTANSSASSPIFSMVRVG